MHNGGVWNEQGATFDFIVLPTWYQTVWFRYLAGAVGLCLLTALYLICIGRVERELTLRFA